MRTNAIVVEISRSPVPSSWDLNASNGGAASDVERGRLTGSEPPSVSRRSRRNSISAVSAGGL
jgi:hypothetical protein